MNNWAKQLGTYSMYSLLRVYTNLRFVYTRIYSHTQTHIITHLSCSSAVPQTCAYNNNNIHK